MTCEQCQERIFDGELEREALAHLTGCDACRELHREVRLNSEALAAMREDVMPVRRARRWPLAAVAAAALTAVGLSYWMAPHIDPTGVPPIVAALPAAQEIEIPPATEIPSVILVKPPAVPLRPGRAVKPAVADEQPMLVKFFTDDPDVVIYWLIDPVQGEQVL